MPHEEFPRRDLRTRAGRMLRVLDAVWCPECTLPSRARLMVWCLAFAAHGREPATMESLCHRMSLRTPRAVRRHIGIVSSACGENAVQFIRDVIDGRRPADEWFRALELHGGRHGA